MLTVLKVFVSGLRVILETTAAVFLSIVILSMFLFLTIGPLVLTIDLEQPWYLTIYLVTILLFGLLEENTC